MKKIHLLLCFLFGGLSVLAQDQTTSKPIIFITDASGSMWQKVDGEFKIALARDVLANLVGEMPAEQQLGLVAYGHRQKGDCADIEEILPASNTDKAAFTKAMNELNPLGKTPLAQSALKVINQLKSSKESATIILITDGIETCSGDLCQIVKEAKAAGVDFVLHVIGFDLGDADRAPLECAAREGEGLYIDASDKDQLAGAVKQTSEITVDVPKGRLSVKTLRNGELIDASVIVNKAGTADFVGGVRTYKDEGSNPGIVHLPTGTYDVEVNVVGQRGIAPQKRMGVVLSETEGKELVFDFTSGYLEIKITENGQLHDATINVTRHGETRSVTGGRTYTGANSNPFKKEISPGWYDVGIKSVDIKGLTASHTIKKIEIKPGETSSHSHEFKSAILKVGATNKGVLWDATVNIVAVNPKSSVAGGRTYTSSSSNPKSFLLSPGTYEVTVNPLKAQGISKKTITVNLKAGETLEKIISW
jgi:Ca-activated chloride channel family protein